MFRPKTTTTPVKKVWRISESAPNGGVGQEECADRSEVQQGFA
jgi:hypothetical protein